MESWIQFCTQSTVVSEIQMSRRFLFVWSLSAISFFRSLLWTGCVLNHDLFFSALMNPHVLIISDYETYVSLVGESKFVEQTLSWMSTVEIL